MKIRPWFHDLSIIFERYGDPFSIVLLLNLSRFSHFNLIPDDKRNIRFSRIKSNLITVYEYNLDDVIGKAAVFGTRLWDLEWIDFFAFPFKRVLL